MRITGLSLLIAFLVVFGMAGCGGQSAEKLIGKWTDGEDHIEITKTHIWLDGGISVDYKIENGSIKVYQPGFTDDITIADSYKFVDKDTLIFVKGESEETFKRKK